MSASDEEQKRHNNLAAAMFRQAEEERNMASQVGPVGSFIAAVMVFIMASFEMTLWVIWIAFRIGIFIFILWVLAKVVWG